LYSLSNPDDFSGADFDLIVNPVGLDGDPLKFGSIAPGPMRIPLPGNQFNGDVWGGRVTLADDYLMQGVLGGNTNIYSASIDSLIRCLDNMDPRILNNFVYSDGRQIVGNLPEQELDFTDAVGENGRSKYLMGMTVPFNPISDAACIPALINAELVG